MPKKRFPPNPIIWSEIPHEAWVRALGPSSEASAKERENFQEFKDGKALRYFLLGADQRSFLTGVAALDLQAARLIKDAHKNGTRKKEVVSICDSNLCIYMTVDALFKESSLTHQLHLHPPTLKRFSLDGIGNAILCECTVGHTALFQPKMISWPCSTRYAKATKSGAKISFRARVPHVH